MVYAAISSNCTSQLYRGREVYEVLTLSRYRTVKYLAQREPRASF